VLSPLVVQLRHSQDPAIDRKLKEARGLLLRVGAILVAMVAVGAPMFYGFLYDPRYHQAATIASLLALNIWASILAASVGGILIAFGDSKSTARVTAARLVGAISGIALGYRVGGQYGLILGTAGAGLATYLAECMALRRWGISIGWSDLRFSIMCLVYTGVGWCVIGLLCSDRIGLQFRWASAIAALAVASGFVLRERDLVVRMLEAIRSRFRQRAIATADAPCGG
jgi:O-antigen/teichoic acid export membrane protein